ncbi:MAG TPA: hypothetical protein VMH80_02270 [Bryobacteraceae bacterium]|nr:hypothetical protein [Bryobacteraceae bacterium]
MALIKPAPTNTMRQTLTDGLKKFVQPDDPMVSALANGPCHWVFTLALPELLGNGGGIAKAKAAGWRFLASSGNDTAAAELSEPPPGGRPLKVRSFARGPQFLQAIHAAREVEGLPQASDQHYELRVLRVPGLLMEGFWLKAQGTGEDYVVPYVVPEGQREYRRVLSMSEFLNTVRPLAEAAIAFDDSPRGRKARH